MKNTQDAILLIYTGGTIGMINKPDNNALAPVDFKEISNQLPELQRFECKIDSHTFEPTRDSSTIHPEFWAELASIIQENYYKYDGFVILHGTDTMAYTASALSFMLDNLDKPVILTGSQLPIGVLRTDGKENLLTAIEIAAAKKSGRAIVPEVCIFFQNELYRGNRTTKHNADYFHAFRSFNYPVLAEAGIKIKYNLNAIQVSENTRPLAIHSDFETQVGILKIFPGMNENWVGNLLHTPGLKGLVMESFGSGNAPINDWFIRLLQKAIARGLVILNVSQCQAGSVDPGKYETSRRIHEIGVISGGDMTTEAALTKLMFLLGKGLKMGELNLYLNQSLSGEISL